MTLLTFAGTTFSETLAYAIQHYGDKAQRAVDLYWSWLEEPLPYAGGAGALERCALGLYQGRTIEECAAREYLYRWKLAIKPFNQTDSRTYWGAASTRNPVCSSFGTPHAIGL